MNECLHGGGTAQTPPGQELDGRVSNEEKERKTKGLVI